jgi:cytidylate kinase
MYRAVTLYALNNGMIDTDGNVDEQALVASLDKVNIDFAVQADGTQHTMLNGVDVEAEIRGMRVSEHVSPVAAIAAVRHDLVAKQQAFGESKGIVMDGRDIGTTVFPNAELKIYVNASAETRAQRRFKELVEKGVEDVNYEEILANVVHRDHIDSTRAESPLRQAEDAICLDNSNMTLDEQDAWLEEQVRKATASK